MLPSSISNVVTLLGVSAWYPQLLKGGAAEGMKGPFLERVDAVLRNSERLLEVFDVDGDWAGCHGPRE